MLTLLGHPQRCCDGITRRESLKAGALGVLGGFGLPQLLQAEQAQRDLRPGKAKNVIVLFLLGGAATQDMFDLKPDAPSGVRSEFKPIASSAPGIQVGEHLPRLSRWMHKAAVVRSVNHKAGCHNPLPAYTGYDRPIASLSSPKDNYPPSIGSVCEYLKPATCDLPAYVHLPHYPGWGEAARFPGAYGGFLGKRYDPLFSEVTPTLGKGAGGGPIWLGEPVIANSQMTAGLTIDRLDTRKTLLKQLDQEQRRLDPVLSSYDQTRQRAFSMLTASKLKEAFDLDRVALQRRQRYGQSLFGASALIGARLLEAGVRFVNVNWEWYHRLAGGTDSWNWDTHSNHHQVMGRTLLPDFDITSSALLEDLDARGLLDETLVMVMTDFGRTPRINDKGGRDHWTYCYSVLFLGAGIRGGTVYGASDKEAAYVKDNPVSTGDVCATIYHCLGIDPDMLVHDRAGRPHPVAQGGKAIREILA